ncbi:MAG: triose-phosphate isomerase [Actinobacteria bacterium ATB1]|nr:triose-phosphate isomerase [Actinobacteria bacterium ATB1]
MSDRLAIIAANWKMHKIHTEAIQFAQKLHYLLDEGDLARVEVPICAPYTDLRTLQTLIDADRLPFKLGAQNVYWEEEGAYTGEVSPRMLRALDVDYVICGHSERRELFAETDEMVTKKVDASFSHGMTPILCVGETLEEREAGEAESKVVGQLTASTAHLSTAQVTELVVAYEPIWAIGTGQTATPDDAQEMCGTIRRRLEELHGAEAAGKARIQYGGSVKPGNIEMIMKGPDVDGALVGGASLDPEDFARILTAW